MSFIDETNTYLSWAALDARMCKGRSYYTGGRYQVGRRSIHTSLRCSHVHVSLACWERLFGLKRKLCAASASADRAQKESMMPMSSSERDRLKP